MPCSSPLPWSIRSCSWATYKQLHLWWFHPIGMKRWNEAENSSFLRFHLHLWVLFVLPCISCNWLGPTYINTSQLRALARAYKKCNIYSLQINSILNRDMQFASFIAFIATKNLLLLWGSASICFQSTRNNWRSRTLAHPFLSLTIFLVSD